jgi:hypothetical protein
MNRLPILRIVAAWLGAVLMLFLVDAGAHEMSIAEMELREVSRGDFLMQWTATQRGPAEDLTPVWPSGCRLEGNRLRCGADGLRGPLRIEGVGQRYSAAMVKVFWADGPMRVYTLTPAQPTVQLYGSADDRRGIGEIAWAYVVLGVEHILGGIDHLLFVIGLLFLVGFRKGLVGTITAFTVAHSLTLGASALGWLSLRAAPVEATIALSILLVASEALRQRQSAARRWPAAVAFLFGLVHGLGFASALQQVGLPQQHLLVALLTFNVGVEIGQLAVVATAWALLRLTSGWTRLSHARNPALYAMGGVAAYWTLGRMLALG